MMPIFFLLTIYRDFNSRKLPTGLEEDRRSNNDKNDSTYNRAKLP